MKKLKKFLKILAIVLGCLVLLLIGLYWLVTSSFFLTGVVLPQVSKSAGMRIEAKTINLRPLSGSIEINDLAIGDKGKELAVGSTVRAKVDAWAFLMDKTIVVEELYANAVTVSITTGSGATEVEAKKTPSGEIKVKVPKEVIPWKVQVSNVKLEKCNFTLVIPRSLGESATIGISDLTLSLPRLANGEPFELDCKLGVEAAIPETLELQGGKFNLKIAGELADNILPRALSVNGELADLAGNVRGKQWQNETYLLNIEAGLVDDVVTLSRAELAVKSGNSETVYGSNTLDATVQLGDHLSGKGNFRVGTISPQLTEVLIDLFCDGYNPGHVEVVCSGNWTYENNVLGSEVQVHASRSGDLLVGKDRFALPELVFTLQESSTVLLKNSEVDMKQLSIALGVDGREVVNAKVEPALYNWKTRKTASGATLPDFGITVRGLDLGMVAKLLPEGTLPVTVESGLFNFRCNATSSPKGITFASSINLMNFTCVDGNLRYEGISLKNNVEGLFAEEQLTLSKGQFSLFEMGVNLCDIAYDGTYNLTDGAAAIRTKCAAQIQPLIEIAPLDGVLKEQLRHYLSPLYPMTANVMAETRFNAKAQQITVGKLDASVAQTGNWFAGLTTSEPIVFSVAEKKLKSGVVADAKVTNFPLNVAGAYAPGMPVKIGGGTFQGSYLIRGTEDLKNMSVTGTGQVKRLDVIAAGKHFTNGTIVNAVDATYHVADKSFELKRLMTSLALSENMAMISELSGKGNLERGDMDLVIGKIDVTPVLASYFTTMAFPDDFLLQLSGSVKASEAMKRYQVQLNSAIPSRMLARIAADADLNTGAVAANVNLSQCNEKLLGLFAPGAFTSASITGDFKAVGNFKDNQWNAAGNFLADAENPKYITEKITGELGFDVNYSTSAVDCRNFTAIVKKGQKSIGDFSVTALWPLADESIAGNVNLNSRHLDLAELQSVLPKSTVTPQGTISVTQPQPVDSGAEPTFDFGGRTITVAANFQSIVYQQYNGGVEAQALLAGRDITLSNLLIKLNKAVLRAQGKAQSTDAGIRYQLAANSDGEVDLATLLDPVLPEAQKGFKGTMTQFSMNFAGFGVKPPTLYDNLNGNLNMKFGALSVPMGIQSTLLGKLFFLPLNIFVQVQDNVPNLTDMTALTTACKSVDSMMKSVQTIDFTGGDVKITSSNGRILIEECDFVGPTVRTLTFDGKLGLGSNQALQLSALIDFTGIKLPMEIGGTLSSPSVNIAKTVASLLTSNATTVLSVIDGAVNGTANGDKGLAGAVGGLLQALDVDKGTTQQNNGATQQNNGSTQKKSGAEEAVGTVLNGLFQQLDRNKNKR